MIFKRKKSGPNFQFLTLQPPLQPQWPQKCPPKKNCTFMFSIENEIQAFGNSLGPDTSVITVFLIHFL